MSLKHKIIDIISHFSLHNTLALLIPYYNIAIILIYNFLKKFQKK